MTADNEAVRRILDEGLPDRVVNRSSLHSSRRVPHACEAQYQRVLRRGTTDAVTRVDVVVLHGVTVGDVNALVRTGQIDEDVGEAERASTTEHDG